MNYENYELMNFPPYEKEERFRGRFVRKSEIWIDDDAYLPYLRTAWFRRLVRKFEDAMDHVGPISGRPRKHAPASLAAMHVLLKEGITDRFAEELFSDEEFWGKVSAVLKREFPWQFDEATDRAPNRCAYRRVRDKVEAEASVVGVIPPKYEYGEEVEPQLVFDVRRNSPDELTLNLSSGEEPSESIVVTITRNGTRTEFYDGDGRKIAENFESYEDALNRATGKKISRIR